MLLVGFGSVFNKKQLSLACWACIERAFLEHVEEWALIIKNTLTAKPNYKVHCIKHSKTLIKVNPTLPDTKKKINIMQSVQNKIKKYHKINRRLALN